VCSSSSSSNSSLPRCHTLLLLLDRSLLRRFYPRKGLNARRARRCSSNSSSSKSNEAVHLCNLSAATAGVNHCPCLFLEAAAPTVTAAIVVSTPLVPALFPPNEVLAPATTTAMITRATFSPPPPPPPIRSAALAPSPALPFPLSYPSTTPSVRLLVTT